MKTSRFLYVMVLIEEQRKAAAGATWRGKFSSTSKALFVFICGSASEVCKIQTEYIVACIDILKFLHLSHIFAGCLSRLCIVLKQLKIWP